ncbi:MAG TPA: hypothetical protein VGF95_14360 [Solirubrobacteraceae bacterium]|jgi:hypothetical protein
MTGGGSERGLGREIVLALIVEQPGTAWDLGCRLRRRLAALDYRAPMVRRTTQRLAELGWIVEDSQGSWAATGAGVARRRQWFAESATYGAWDRLFAQVALCTAEEMPLVLATLWGHEVECERHLAALRDPEGDIAKEAERDLLRMRLDWLRGVRGKLTGG